jgi:hypothetical protein
VFLSVLFQAVQYQIERILEEAERVLGGSDAAAGQLAEGVVENHGGQQAGQQGINGMNQRDFAELAAGDAALQYPASIWLLGMITSSK